MFPVYMPAKTMIFRVYYKDKGPEKFEEGTNLYKKTLSILSDRAIKRRLKVRTKENLITIEDAPVYKKYIDSIRGFNIEIIHNLRWLNYSVVACDSSEYDSIYTKIKNLDFVEKVNTAYLFPDSVEFKNDKDTLAKRKFSPDEIFIPRSDYFGRNGIYGESYSQVAAISADKLHQLGITGDSVLIGILDSGFDWKNHSSLKDAKIIAEYDFVNKDSNTANEIKDSPTQDNHGTGVLSLIAAVMPGNLIGISPGSMFLLAKTESIPYEICLEEDNYAAAIEWLESLGVDITSSSLAYRYFDDYTKGYDYEQDLDGNSTITSIYINKAVSRGIICLTAAGNDGPEAKTLYTPADADSAITCGAISFVNNMITPAKFSSRGPTGAGVIKPDIAAPGVSIIGAGNSYSTHLVKSNGTSLATPITAGAVALLLSCFPDLPPWKVRNILYSTAMQYPYKDNSTGYGLIDIMEAVRKTGTMISPPVINKTGDYLRFVFHILPKGDITATPYLSINIGGTDRKYYLYETNKRHQYAAYLPLEYLKNNIGVAKLHIVTSHSETCYPRDNSFIIFDKNTERINLIKGLTELPLYNNDKELSVSPSVGFYDDNYIDICYDLQVPSSVSIQIYDIKGRRFFKKYYSLRQRGIINEHIAVDTLPAGVYYVTINDAKQVISEKFLVQR